MSIKPKCPNCGCTESVPIMDDPEKKMLFLGELIQCKKCKEIRSILNDIRGPRDNILMTKDQIKNLHRKGGMN